MSETIDDEDAILPHVWASHGRLRADKVALICGDRSVSWSALNAAANRVANGLAALGMGMGKGTKIALLMSNSVEMVEIMLGIVKSGACLVPLSTMLTPGSGGGSAGG